ncbi:hypothetical protein [Chlorogloea sp. CCALA 695]|uniref:hypothetical protein n=1 Tax=Chlorogloea sp. CCALA 695 TaxID=2107693 RepID=UPI0018ED005F|nr:hypothetical protein [Chlorogloea sp. CCALA 695]
MKIIQVIGIILGVTLVIWVLRGFGILSFIPGGILWLLLLSAASTGIFGIVQDKLRRL